ncbi:LysR family transcriptional regulator [Clostridium omnivorum]|uniref:LysR family transcriptional regulator n=1 Tax=Clostridium omnivorum TaxID=1604902 RepID=A0ABQ5N7Y1_9CLOT|nr:LysR family transcriptional regulator [Clostridium sp. E14]GLC31246.1 LysR family transcriptional regulator [Clostridium sp. E14]
MDIKQLVIFTTIVEEGNITAAAKKLHIAQPALSNQLKLMEEELGTKLMNRGSRKMTLTDAGEILYRKAKHISALTQSIHKEITDYNNGLAGTLRIGITPMVDSTLINGNLINFNKENPQIKYELYEGSTYEILELLFNGIIEAGIVRTPFNTNGLDIQYWDKEPMIALYNSNYSFLNIEDTISVKDLKGKPIIIVRKLAEILTAACLDEGFEPNIFCLNNYLPVNLLWAQAGLGVAVAPLSALNLVTDKAMNYKIIDVPSFYTQIAIITVKDRYLSAVSKKFLEMVGLDKSFR